MQCPACEKQTTHIIICGTELDVCQGGCGGIWFDNYELNKFDETHEEAGQLLDIEMDSNVKLDLETRRNCPKCVDIKLMRHYFSIKRKVVVDECANCGGIWLDGGELNKARGLYASEEDKKIATENLYNELFQREIGKESEQLYTNKNKQIRMGNILKFIH
ncbi:zf-TFIIB domain-containing protein [Prochlorococcus sp. MIT 1303]|uniref:TFIIB-type zinc ribbon-containing protein n=1 Tax=Prochlorococcus sp. MIT 1303 TaxID=1723647 RepID=UPI0007B39BD7|nr:zf-TFIIB domain-containing protein [Prochlorococcus sp. MIT 1303]KZR61907.1 hypothetical protein PMIT1303_02109 [Prochlorococcus sp. MIT 1303]